MLVGRFPDTVRNASILSLFIVTLLLTFSRAACDQFVASAVLMISLARSRRQRTRIVAFTLLGVVALLALITALLLDLIWACGRHSDQNNLVYNPQFGFMDPQ